MAQIDPIVLGWREWLALPQFGIAAIRTKIDSGARTSSLRVESVEPYDRDGDMWLHFVVLTGRRRGEPVHCDAPAIARRPVCDSGGHVTERWFIRTDFELAGCLWQADMNLTQQSGMRFPLLLGRNALAGRFIVDASAAYRHGRPRALRRHRNPP